MQNGRGSGGKRPKQRGWAFLVVSSEMRQGGFLPSKVPLPF